MRFMQTLAVNGALEITTGVIESPGYPEPSRRRRAWAGGKSSRPCILGSIIPWSSGGMTRGLLDLIRVRVGLEGALTLLEKTWGTAANVEAAQATSRSRCR